MMPSAPAPGPPNMETNKGFSPDTSPSRTKRVLVVDDDPGLLDVITAALQRGGREVVPCRAYEDARQKLLTEEFGILLTDVRLGAFNGIQLAVIARDKHPDMGIIVFSGFDDSVLRAEAERVGAYYLVKPVTSEELLNLMGTL